MCWESLSKADTPVLLDVTLVHGVAERKTQPLTRHLKLDLLLWEDNWSFVMLQLREGTQVVQLSYFAAS